MTRLVTEYIDRATGLHVQANRTSAALRQWMPEVLWSARPHGVDYGMTTGDTAAEAIGKWVAANPQRIAA